MFQIWSQRINHLIINVFLTLGIKAGIDSLPFAIFVTPKQRENELTRMRRNFMLQIGS